ncbi:hypothetical protein [Chitinophaga sp. 212800010-3]|uniref:hypothetical protein n=1 Tax=unclassified Chitinophaga TaxID=2619133 RepID=UPI002DECA0BA|nr:hypothetical protein [Chitinophaga sp. 212800010-3]
MKYYIRKTLSVLLWIIASLLAIVDVFYLYLFFSGELLEGIDKGAEFATTYTIASILVILLLVGLTVLCVFGAIRLSRGAKKRQAVIEFLGEKF